MPVTSTITTSTGSGLGATYIPINGGTEHITRIALDLDSVARYFPPIAPSRQWRRPFASNAAARFPQPAVGSQRYIKQTGASTLRGYWFKWYPATAKVATAFALKLDASVYEIADNGAVFNHFGCSLYWTIDAAGVAALQPACAQNIVGYVGSGTILLSEATSRPSWVVQQPYPVVGNSGTTQVLGPIQNPFFYLNPSNALLYRNGSVWKPITTAWASYGFPIFNGLGPANDWIVYHVLMSIMTGLPAPTTSVTLTWFDESRAAISTVTFGPFTWQLLSSSGGLDHYGIAADMDISALSPPTNARGYLMAQTGTTATYLQPRTMGGGSGFAGPILGPYPYSSADGGGYIPGVVTT